MAHDLRAANQELLRKLKKSQNEISRLIVAAKHSDPRFLESVPLTSTMANTKKGAITKSRRVLSEAHRNLTKSPGILKRSLKDKKRPSKPLEIENSFEEEEEENIVTSQFLQQQTAKGKSLTFADCPKNQPLLTNPGNERPYQARDSSKKVKSFVVESSPEKRSQNISDTFTTPVKHQEPMPHPPLLGYDWIAGVLENENPSPNNMSDDFLDDIKEFRKLNRSDCHSRKYWNEMMKTPKTPLLPLPRSCLKSSRKSPDPSDTTDARIINFTINKRLFPIPVDPDDDVEPGTKSSPRYVRVSVPKSSLSSPYRYKPRQGVTEVETDSLSLPQHCFKGWKNFPPTKTNKEYEQSYSSLDLRSYLQPQECLANLQLKSGQASIPNYLKHHEKSSYMHKWGLKHNSVSPSSNPLYFTIWDNPAGFSMVQAEPAQVRSWTVSVIHTQMWTSFQLGM